MTGLYQWLAEYPHHSYNAAMSRSFKLFRLQQVDSSLDQVRARLKEIDRILGDDEALQQAKAVQEQAGERKVEAEKDLHRAETEVKDQQVKIEQNQARLYGGKISNPKELQDLQQEAEALKRHLSDLEDIQLEKMLSLEEMQMELDNAQQGLDSLRVERTREHGNLGAEHEELESEQARLSDERAAAVSTIPDEDMRPYLKLRESKNGLAVAKVNNKICGACGTTLSESLAQAARSPNEISKCSTCKRILYAG